MRWTYVLIIGLQCAYSQRSRYRYYDPFYQYYGRYHQGAVSRSRGRQGVTASNAMQRDESFKRLQGNNVCVIKEVFGVGERYYEEFMEDIPDRVCKRMTFYRRKCCTGYSRSESENGCTNVKELHDLVETAKKLNLHTFVRLLTNTELEVQLRKSGAFTLFIPTDKAFQNISHGDRQRLHPWTYNAPSLLHYHVIRGRHNYTKFLDEDVETLYYGKKYIRINTYKHGINTVNCARILRPNQLAHNGIIHIIDRMIKPLDIQGDISGFVLRDPRLTQFARIIYAADLINFFRKAQSYTLFVPDDDALSKMPKELSSRIFTDRKIAKAIVKHHTVTGIFCGASTIGTTELETQEGGSVTFNCRYNGRYIDNAKITEADLVVENGVVHIISQVLLPNIVKTSMELLRDLRLKTLVDLIHRAGLRHTLLKNGYTLFAPSEQAFADLPPSHLAALQNEPGLVEKLINYHTIPSTLTEDDMIHEQKYQTTMPNTHIKISVFKSGILVNDAHIVTSDLESSNAIVHIVDRVLVPPEHSLLDLIRQEHSLRDFLRYAEQAGITDILSDQKSQKTIFAPTNGAWRKVERKVFSDKKLLKQFLLRHIADDVIVSTAIADGESYTFNSIQSENIKLKKAGKDIVVNEHSKAVEVDRIAMNGYLFIIDQTIYCRCRGESD